MNKRTVALFAIIFSIIATFGYCQVVQVSPAAPNPETKTLDINKDGQSDVTYYRDQEHVSKVEADTNYDGKTDTVINLKDGKFESAQVDTDHDGTYDKSFSDSKQFNDYVNQSNPDFEESLNRPDWQWNLMKF